MIKELKKILKKEGHCKESCIAIDNAKDFRDVVNAIFYYKKELAKKHFPSIKFVDKYYRYGKMAYNMFGFFHNEKLSIKNVTRIILTGNCDCDLYVSDFKISEVLLMHNSKVRIYTSGNAVLRLYVCENSSYEVISQEGNSKIRVRNYE